MPGSQKSHSNAFQNRKVVFVSLAMSFIAMVSDTGLNETEDAQIGADWKTGTNLRQPNEVRFRVKLVYRLQLSCRSCTKVVRLVIKLGYVL